MRLFSGLVDEATSPHIILHPTSGASVIYPWAFNFYKVRSPTPWTFKINLRDFILISKISSLPEGIWSFWRMSGVFLLVAFISALRLSRHGALTIFVGQLFRIFMHFRDFDLVPSPLPLLVHWHQSLRGLCRFEIMVSQTDCNHWCHLPSTLWERKD